MAEQTTEKKPEKQQLDLADLKRMVEDISTKVDTIDTRTKNITVRVAAIERLESQTEDQMRRAAREAIEEEADQVIEGAKNKTVHVIKKVARELKPSVPNKQQVKAVIVAEALTLGAARFVPGLRYTIIELITP